VAAQDAEQAGEPEAPAGELGAVEGLKDACLRRLVHATARVLDLEGNVLAFRQLAETEPGAGGRIVGA